MMRKWNGKRLVKVARVDPMEQIILRLAEDQDRQFFNACTYTEAPPQAVLTLDALQEIMAQFQTPEFRLSMMTPVNSPFLPEGVEMRTDKDGIAVKTVEGWKIYDNHSRISDMKIAPEFGLPPLLERYGLWKTNW